MSGKKDTQAQDHPTIEVKDFGPIAHGKVELRPLTVFAGPSNTGKSWLATLIYALRRSGNRISPSSDITCDEIAEDKKNNSLKIPENPAAWIKYTKAGLPISLTKKEKSALQSILEQKAGKFDNEIRRCFGISEPAYLIREQARKGFSIVRLTSPKGALTEFKLKGDKISCTVSLPENPLIFPDISGALKNKDNPEFNL